MATLSAIRNNEPTTNANAARVDTKTGVIEVNPQGGKTARMFSAAAEWQPGDWFLSRNAAWTEPFIEQVTMFPAGRNDDMGDMMSQAAAWLLQANAVTVTITNAFTGRPIDESF